MITKIKEYVKENPDEEILVYLWYHWSKNALWPFSMNDVHELAKISSNIRIMIDSCNFGSIYDQTIDNMNDDFQSSVSWFSGKNITTDKEFLEVDFDTSGGYVTNNLRYITCKKLWFYERMIYSRTSLWYMKLAPLTVKREYTNRKTWNKETSIVWMF
jgi:hypothetical protein